LHDEISNKSFYQKLLSILILVDIKIKRSFFQCFRCLPRHHCEHVT